PEDAEAEARALAKCFEGASDLCSRTTRFRCKDGHGIWVQISASLLRDERGKPTASFCVTQDITERKKAEAEMARREEKFRTMTQMIPEIIWTADPGGTRDFHNQRWEQYTGLTAEQSAGWGWTRAIVQEDLPGVLSKWTHCYSSGEPYQVEYRL